MTIVSNLGDEGPIRKRTQVKSQGLSYNAARTEQLKLRKVNSQGLSYREAKTERIYLENLNRNGDEGNLIDTSNLEEDTPNNKLQESAKDKEVGMYEFWDMVPTSKKLSETANKVGYGALFDKMDTDHDGKVGDEELKTIFGTDINYEELKMEVLENYLLEAIGEIPDAEDDKTNDTTNDTTDKEPETEPSEDDKESDSEEKIELGVSEFTSLISSSSQLTELAGQLGYGALFDALDKNHDGRIGQEELQLIFGDDMNLNNLSVKSLENYLKSSFGVKDETNNDDSSPGAEVSNSNSAAVQNNYQTQTPNTPASSSNSSSYSSSNSGGSGATSVQTQSVNAESLEGLQAQKENAQGELKTQQDALSAIYSGEYGDDEVLNGKQKAVDDAKRVLDNCFGDDDSNAGLWKEVFDGIENNIKLQDEIIDAQKPIVTAAETQMKLQESNLKVIDEQIKALNTAIKDLNAQRAEAEKKGDSALVAKIDKKIKELQAQIDELQKQRDEVQKAYDNACEQYTTAQAVLEKAETEKTRLEGEKSMHLEELASIKGQNIRNAYVAYDKAKQELEEAKAKRIAEIETKIGEIQDSILEIDTKIQELKLQKIERDKRVATVGDDIAEFARQFEGMPQDKMQKLIKSYISPYGTEKDPNYKCHDAWCADFVTFCIGEIYGEDAPSWFKAITNKAYVPTIRNEVNAKGVKNLASTPDQIQSGDILIFRNSNGSTAAHTGIAWRRGNELWVIAGNEKVNGEWKVNVRKITNYNSITYAYSMNGDDGL